MCRPTRAGATERKREAGLMESAGFARAFSFGESMIRKRVKRFSEKIMLKQESRARSAIALQSASGFVNDFSQRKFANSRLRSPSSSDSSESFQPVGV
jgi:hypothetical protein